MKTAETDSVRTFRSPTDEKLARPEKILIVDDDAGIRKMFRLLLEEDGYEALEAADGLEALEMLEGEKPTLAFLDIDMPKMDGLEVLEEMQRRGIDVPVIVMTGYSSMETAIRALRSGAYEYLAKPLEFQKVQLLTRRCLDEQRLKSELKLLREKLPATEDRYELIGTSPPMLEIYKSIGAIAGTPNTTNVLILGESGTGKELVARQIHRWGKHPEKPFVALNVTALPDSLLESELFGFEKGAFTGAAQRKHGKFQQAEEGTIFLDEIGDLSLDLQQKLLRAIQEREFVRLGGHETIPVKARFIAATHGDLEKRVSEGKFRQDLYFRLNVVTLRLPLLRERKEDIPLLAQHFAQKAAKQMGRDVWQLTPETIERLCSYHWPGNVRELENTVARAMVMVPGDRILPGDLALPESAESPGGEIDPEKIDPPVLHHNLKEARRLLLDAFEEKFLSVRLKETHGNVTQAAERAGVNRQSFQRLMQKYGLRSGQFK